MLQTKHFIIGYTGTKAEIEAVSPVATGSRAVTTDTDESGFYDGSAWVWSESPVITSFLNANHTHAAAGATGGVVDHVNTSNKQGGTTGEYYHATSAEYTGTGTGNFVRATSPTLVTPVLGVATATSVMGLTTAQVTDLTDGGATTLHSHPSTAAYFQRVQSADMGLADGECLVITGYLDLVTYSLTLDGDAQLEVL